ncbi:MAG: hypothetical protein Q9221_008696 [Calogaya cf. arnoldii]
MASKSIVNQILKSKGRFLFGSKACTIWALVTVAICYLVAALIYLVFHFRGLIPKNDIQRILATWGTPGSPSEAQAQRPASFSRGVVPIPCHSHNDEERPVPLYNALEVGCTSVEADVWLQGGDLLVGHSKDSLKPSRTLQSLYIDPLLSILGHQNPALNLTGSHANESAPLPGCGYLARADATAITPPSLGLLTHFDGFGVTEGPITVVGTGHADFRALVSNTTDRDIFFDAPLDQLWGEDTPGNATAYTADNSHYASTSFAASIGELGSEVWRPGRCTRSGARSRPRTIGGSK